MQQEPSVNRILGVTNLIDALLDFKMESKEFLSNEKIVSKVGETIDKLNKSIDGHVLLSITRDKIRNLLLLTKEGSYFTTYKWKINESIDKTVGVDIHEENYQSDLPEFINENYNGAMTKSELVSALVVPSLNGFNVNKVSAKQLIDIKNKDERNYTITEEEIIKYNKNNAELIPLAKRILHKIDIEKANIKEILTDLISKNKIEMTLSQDFPHYNAGKIFAGEMTRVKEIGGRRHFEVKWFSLSEFNNKINYGRITKSCSPAVDAVNITTFNNIYMFRSRNYYGDDYDPTKLEDIPYNLVDKGRLIITVPQSSSEWKTLISPDPRVDEKFKETFEKDVEAFLKNELENSHSIINSVITIPSMKATISYRSYEESQKKATPELKGIRLKLKALKTMIEEHNYIVKKNSSIGEDVTVTDNIKYNHKEGKIAYNDFSISVQDEFVKAKLYILFNDYLMQFYRSETTEQDILDMLIRDVFDAIEKRINSGTKTDLNLPIKINDKIEINITGKMSKRYAKDDTDTNNKKDKKVISESQLFYINNRRFNKNEVLMVLKEMTCYRSQEEADNFINNIGRLGLSTYIGISTGYEVDFNPPRKYDDEHKPDNKIFRFKKLKGRSKYELLLDDTSIPINGKNLINILYQEFIGDRVPDFLAKIPKIIYDSSNSSMHYLKYKVLIDSTYRAFKDRSKEYLDKKVEELDGTYVKYFNKKSKKLMDAIRIEGQSGKKYIIAYDSKDSYVFMDSELQTDSLSGDHWKEGKYICMIDQSNIKSNISYDTIVAKLLALKNDSSIAHTIYNLQEELE